MLPFRHTKIIATAGPATRSDAALDELVSAGVDIFRLNFSHGTHESHAQQFASIRRAASRAGRVIAVMQDLGGPKIRTGPLEGGQSLQLNPGDELILATGDFVGSPGRISTNSPELVRSVRPGDFLLLDDGHVQLRVVSTGPDEVVTSVVDGGALGEHKGINAPGVMLATSALTPKDVVDARFGVELGVDIIALSFVQSAADLHRAREVLAAAGAPTLPLVAKIERPAAVEHLEEVLRACEGVMVARGDLGLEVPLERVPRIQKEITARARALGVPVIVATQVLESMRTEPRPTRAEVSDAANAVDDGVDAIMLAGETAVGQYASRAVHTLDIVIREAEAILAGPSPFRFESAAVDIGHGRALCDAAVTLATSGQADAIVAVTRAGMTARLLSALRPRAPIFAITENEATARSLALYRGVMPLVYGPTAEIDSIGERSEEQLVAKGLLAPGSVVVSVSVAPDLSRADANFLRLRRLTG